MRAGAGGGWLVLARVMTRTAGWQAARRGAALYLGIAMVAGVLFGGKNGMRADDVTRLARGSPAVGAALWGLWLVAALPTARTLLEAPPLLYLRALPVPRWRFWAVHAAHLAVAEAPWVVLWARGEGFAAGLLVAVTAAAAHAFLVARPLLPLPADGPRASRAGKALGGRRGVWIEWAAGGAALGIAFSRVTHPAVLPVAAAALVITIRAAWRRAPERGGERRLRAVGGRAVLALASTHFVTLLRGHAAMLLRALLATLIGAAAAALLLRNNEVARAASVCAISLGAAAVVLPIALAGLAAPVQRGERAARWLLDVTATSGAVRLAAAAAAVALWGALFGALHGGLVAVAISASPALALRLAAGAALAGVLLGIASMDVARRAEREDEVDGGDLYQRGLLVVGPSVTAVALLHELALGALALAVFALCAASATWAARPSSRWREAARRGAAPTASGTATEGLPCAPSARPVRGKRWGRR